jgi:hypothetical protein
MTSSIAPKPQFLCLDLPLLPPSQHPVAAIEQALQPYGEPLRWAITGVNRDRQLMTIEAVVLPNSVIER